MNHIFPKKKQKALFKCCSNPTYVRITEDLTWSYSNIKMMIMVKPASSNQLNALHFHTVLWKVTLTHINNISLNPTPKNIYMIILAKLELGWLYARALTRLHRPQGKRKEKKNVSIHIYKSKDRNFNLFKIKVSSIVFLDKNHIKVKDAFQIHRETRCHPCTIYIQYTKPTTFSSTNYWN